MIPNIISLSLSGASVVYETMTENTDFEGVLMDSTVWEIVSTFQGFSNRTRPDNILCLRTA